MVTCALLRASVSDHCADLDYARLASLRFGSSYGGSGGRSRRKAEGEKVEEEEEEAEEMDEVT
jgi:hypothetical protein